MQVATLEMDLESAIALEDFAKSGQIQKQVELKKKEAHKHEVGVETNKTRYGKGEEAKHKMIDAEIELRTGALIAEAAVTSAAYRLMSFGTCAGMLESLVRDRTEQEQKALTYVQEQGAKITAGTW